MTMLVFQLGEGSELEADLSADIVTLGRADDNDIVIGNAWISWHHARFERAGGVVRVIDLNSRNGILLNEKRVTDSVLKSGDVLTFGQLQAIFRDTGDDGGSEARPVQTPPPRAAATVPLAGARVPQPLVPRPAPARPGAVPGPGRIPGGSPTDPNPMAANGQARKNPPAAAPAFSRATPTPVVAPTSGEESIAANGENVQQFAKGLIKRIDLLDDLIANVAGRDAGAAGQLGPLRASFEELLREHSVEPFTVEVGRPLDVATRKKINIVEATAGQEGTTEIAEVFRPGYVCQKGPGGAPIVLRKAEVRTRKPGAVPS